MTSDALIATRPTRLVITPECTFSNSDTRHAELWAPPLHRVSGRILVSLMSEDR